MDAVSKAEGVRDAVDEMGWRGSYESWALRQQEAAGQPFPGLLKLCQDMDAEARQPSWMNRELQQPLLRRIDARPFSKRRPMLFAVLVVMFGIGGVVACIAFMLIIIGVAVGATP